MTAFTLLQLWKRRISRWPSGMCSPMSSTPALQAHAFEPMNSSCKDYLGLAAGKCAIAIKICINFPRWGYDACHR